MSDIRQSIAEINKGKQFRGIVLERMGAQIAVQLFTNGQKLYGVKLIGGAVNVGDMVTVDYVSGQPVAYAVGGTSAASAPVSTISQKTVISDSPPVSAHTHAFISLSDVPQDYTDSQNKFVQVNSAGSGLVFTDMQTIDNRLIILNDASSGSTLTFPPTSAGLMSAIAASGIGDTLIVPSGRYDGDITVQSGMAVVGAGVYATTLTGKVTISGSAASVSNLQIVRHVNLSSVAAGIDTNGYGDESLLYDLRIEVHQTGSGDCHAIHLTSERIYVAQAYLQADTTGAGTCYGIYLTSIGAHLPTCSKVTFYYSMAAVNRPEIVTYACEMNWGLASSTVNTGDLAAVNHTHAGASNTILIADEGVSAGSAAEINFVGSGVTATVSGSTATVTITSGSGGGSSLIVLDEGVSAGSAAAMNFVGSGVTATVSGSTATINIPNGGSSLTVLDEGVSAGSAAAMNFVGQGVTATVSGSTATVTITSGSGFATDYLWMPDHKPATAGAVDDEFAGDLSAWTEFDPDSILTPSIANSMLKMAVINKSGNNICGMLRSIPAGNFSVTIKCARKGTASTSYSTLLFLAESTASNSKLVTLEYAEYGTDIYLQVLIWTDRNNVSSSPINLGKNWAAPNCYLRIRRASTTYSFDISGDGIGWIQVYTGTLAFTPAYFGPGMRQAGTSTTVYSTVDFFRYKDSDVGIDGILEGQLAPVGTSGSAALLSDTNPSALGTVSAGSGARASRYDHVHPTTGILKTTDFDDIQRFGFLDQSETTITFDGTKIFTLGDAGAGWSYWHSGLKYTISGSKTIDLTTVENPLIDGRTYYIYIDGATGDLSASITSWTLLDTKVPVATILWDNTATPKYWPGEERHSCLIDRRMHWYEHTTSGTKAVTTGALSGYTVDSDVNANKTVAIAATVIADEDMRLQLSALTQPNGTATDYVVFYRTAASTWKWKASNMPFVYNVGNTNDWIQYDNAGTMTDLTGGTGANTRWVNSYLLFTNINGAARYAIIMGQSIFTSLAAAQAESPASFTLAGLPFVECVFAYRLTWTTITSTSQGKCRLAATPQQISVSAMAMAGGTTINHNSLAGLQGGGAAEYYHLTSAQHVIATQASGSAQAGYLSSADWTTFNGKQVALTNPITGSGSIGQISFFNGPTTITSGSSLFWDDTNKRLGIDTNTPVNKLTIGATVANLPSTMQIMHGGGDWGLVIKRNTNDGGSSNFAFLKSRGDANTPSVSGDAIGRISWHAVNNDATPGIVEVAELGGNISTVSAANVSGFFSFKTKSLAGALAPVVMIGNADDTQILDVAGKIRSRSWLTINNLNSIGGDPGGDNRAAIIFGANNTSQGFYLGAVADSTAATMKMGLYAWGGVANWVQTWDAATGNVGIGTTTPNVKLEVNGATAIAAYGYTPANNAGKTDLYVIGSDNGAGAGNGSISLRQVWNSAVYPVNLVGKPSAGGGAASNGLLIQTSYWNGASISTVDRFYIDGYNGNVGIGTTSLSSLRFGQKLEIAASANNSGMVLSSWTATTHSSTLDFTRSNSATIGTHGILGYGDALGSICFRGSDGAQFLDGVDLITTVGAAPSAGVMPSGTLYIYQTNPAGTLDYHHVFTSAYHKIRDTYPYLSLYSTYWSNEAFIQSGVTGTGGANGDYLLIASPSGKKIGFNVNGLVAEINSSGLSVTGISQLAGGTYTGVGTVSSLAGGATSGTIFTAVSNSMYLVSVVCAANATQWGVGLVKYFGSTAGQYAAFGVNGGTVQVEFGISSGGAVTIRNLGSSTYSYTITWLRIY